MLASKAKWNFYNKLTEPSELTDSSTDMSETTLDLLMQRGITTVEAAKKFMAPDLVDLHSPALLPMIDIASKRVHQAIADQEQILIYGDYDADGVSSTTLLLKTLKELGANCDYYIPNRFTEGYGPNEGAFRQAYEDGFRVIITVDTGIASVDEAKVAKELGIDLIITDHHELQEELPDAYAIINPRCEGDYPFEDLAGVGVAFKFAEYLLGYFPEHLLDLVALGTIADLVPLVDENRILAFHGLRALSATQNKGFRALKRLCNIDGDVTEENVGFLIGPRINAVGRLQDAELAVQLLMTDDTAEAVELAEAIQAINEERQQIVRSIVVEAEEMVQTEDKQSVIIVAKEGWNEGVLGIVASQLVRKFDRPAIVLTIKPETSEVKGSARSIPAFNLFKNCMEVRELFTNFGGHSQAAGMSLPKDNLGILEEKLNALIKEQLNIEDFKQVIEVNKTLEISDMTEGLVNEVNTLAPFGMANPKPVFHLQAIPTDIRQIGNLKNHLKFQFKDKETVLEGIGFGLGEQYIHITPHTPISIVGELDINEWNGNKRVQIVMRDIQIEENQLFDHRGKKDVSILPYMLESQRHVVLSKENSIRTKEVANHSERITYDTDIALLSEVDRLYIFDLPTELTQLETIIKVTKPTNIHACFFVEDSKYLTAIPSRDDFKWFYGLISKRKQLNLQQEIPKLMNRKSWTKSQVEFIIKVFLELEFIEIAEDIAQLNPTPVKADLQESILYQSWLSEAEIERQLYYSNYDELKTWFADCTERIDITKEGHTDGL